MHYKAFKTRLMRWFVWFEHYILPLIFLQSIYRLIGFLVDKGELGKIIFRHLLRGYIDNDEMILLSLILAKFFMIFLYGFVVLGLLVHKPVKEYPDRWREILIPFAVTFIYLGYPWISYLPPPFNDYFLPGGPTLAFIIIGTVSNIAGIVVATLATFDLRYAFTIFVEARDLITHGIYTKVRHPIYLGYVLSNVGICLILPKIGYAILCTTALILMVYRARLEERKLVGVFPGYRDYMRRTPFLFPIPFGKRKP